MPTRNPNVVLSPEEIASALRDRPHLTAQVVTIRDDKTLNPQRKLERITALIRGDAAPPVAVPKQISELEAAQAAWRPTSAQLDGARKAAAEFGQWAIAAEEIRPSKPVGRVWSNFGGEALERQSMLQHVDLIDARYLISLHQHGGVVPRWQHVPPAARINASNVWRLWGWQRMFSLGILVLSYPWLDNAHPDQQGEQLGRIVPILKHMLEFCGGEEYSVGVLWDYCSLPQPGRSPEEEARFQSGLASLMTWYAHPYTHVLLMAAPLPTGAAYTNTRPYDARGWCEVERRICAVSKCVHCMWDYSGYSPEALQGLEGMKLYDALRETLKTGRTPPLAPHQFAKRLRSKVESGHVSFSNASDLELVISMYERSFVGIFEHYREFDADGFFAAYAALEWGDAEAKQIATALEYAGKHCKQQQGGGGPSRSSGGSRGAGGGVSLRLEGNRFGSAGQQAIQKAVKAARALFSGVMF